MVEYVSSGEKILATQYNDLVDLAKGVSDFSQSEPFTGSAAGKFINSGSKTRIQQQKLMNSILQIVNTVGKFGDNYSGYDENAENTFSGIWAQWPNFEKAQLLFYHAPFFAQNTYFFTIDPTASENDFSLLWMVNDQSVGNPLIAPLCKRSETATIVAFQIVNDTGNSVNNGSVFAIAGSWGHLGVDKGELLTTSITSQMLQTILSEVRSACPLLAEVAEVRLVGEWVMYDNWSQLEEEVIDSAPIGINVGQLHIESIPDSTPGYMNLSSTMLSSVAFTPAKQLGNQEENSPTFTYSLFNFDKIEDAKKEWNEVYEPEPPDLSSWDLLVRHKAPHPKTAENQVFETQCSAYLDYVPLSGFLAADSEIDPIKGTQDTQCSSIQHNSDDSSLQLFKFDDPSTVNPYEQLSGYDLVLRDNLGAKSKVVYAPLSCLSADISSEVSTIVSVYIENNISTIISSAVKIDSADGGLDSIGRDAGNRLELYEFSTRQSQPLQENSDIVVRDNTAQRVDYVTLSSLAASIVTPDTDVTQGNQCSIQKKQNNNAEQLQLYEFDTANPNRTLHLTLKYDGVPRYIHENGNGDNPDQYTQFITRDSNNQVIVSYDNVSITAPRVPASQVDNIINEISGDIYNIVISGATDLSADLSALSAQLSNYWKVDGTYSDNCYGKSIGDTNQTRVFDLTNRAAYDASGTARMRWSASTIINDANGANVLYAGNYAGSYQRYLFHMNGDWTVDFNNCLLKGPGATNQLDWKNRSLGGDWSTGGTHTMNTLKIGNTTLNETQLQQLLQLLQPSP